MKSALLLAVGVLLGFAAAHAVNRTPQGKQFFEGVDARLEEYRAAAVDGFRARNAEVRALAAEADAAAADRGSVDSATRPE
jgi:hypothetical protein